MSDNNVKEYKSENPLVQKCLDILDKPEIKIVEHGLLLEAWLNGRKCFSVGALDGPLFINSFTFHRINDKDIDVLVKKCNDIMKASEIKTYQYALYWLEHTNKAEPVVSTKPTFKQKLKKLFQRERE